MTVKATFQQISTSQPLPRSSHTLSIVKGKAYIFGGEIRPREPVDNAVHIFTLPSSSVAEADYQCVPATSRHPGAEVPCARVGPTATTLSDRIYVFGGRGGKEMQPLEEKGRVWVFDTISHSWSYLDPVPGTQYPEARSYHASTANEHPLPSKEVSGLSPSGVSDLDDHGTIFIHGGCPASGRTADVWSFDIAARTWAPLPDAPGPPRGGPCLAFAQNRLYRFGGFDGKNELGGQIDFLEMAKSTIDDHSGKDELMVIPRTGNWETIEIAPDAPNPGKRSVAGFHAVTTGQGRNYLILIFGEGDPSTQGHEGAGKFYSDVWSYQLKPEGMTAASLTDATLQLVGSETAEGTWSQVHAAEATMENGKLVTPGARGWFASAEGGDIGRDSVVLWGGIDEKNERKGDGWIIKVGG